MDFPQAIAYAHIQNFSNGEATISNHEGYFDIEVDSDEDIIRISHLGYQKLEISAADLKKETKFCLNHEILLLPEVIVGGFSDFELLQKAILNTHNKLLLPGKIDGYYKEFVVTNGEYTRFSDGAISYYVHNVKGDVVVDGEIKESRAYALPSTTEVDIDLISPINYKVSMDYYDPENLGKFFKKDSDFHYDFELLENSSEYMIKAKPKEASEAYFEGAAVIHKSDTTLSRVSWKVPEDKIPLLKEVNALVMRVKIKAFDGEVIYTQSKTGTMYPFYIRLHFQTHSTNKKGTLDQVNSFISDAQIYGVPEDQSPIPKSNQYTKKSLYKRGTQYQTEYWKDKSVINLTQKEIEIIESFSENN